MPTANTVYELRRYRLKPGSFEALTTLFEREFIETQEAVGITINGIYRDLEDPDAFVWIRSFPDMENRARALEAFYGGPTWEKWGAEANVTMLNSDNVLLMRPIGTPFPLERRSSGECPIDISTCSLAPGQAEDFARRWSDEALPILTSAGARVDAAFVSEHSPNTFPRLPVREGETVFVWVAAFSDQASKEVYQSKLEADSDWRQLMFPWLDKQLWRPLETVSLSPTTRSNHGW